jgi:hypothetical protein
MHVDWAFWNVADPGLTCEVPENPPFLFGSGKLGTPCERMHCANLMSLARVAGETELDVPPPRRLWHACLAARYVGEFWSMPSLAVILNPTDPFSTVGSGKLDTPCERMHSEYSSASVAPDTVADGDADEDEDEDEDGTAATPGLLDPLEHPAAKRPMPTIAAARVPARRALSPRRVAASHHDLADIIHSP